MLTAARTIGHIRGIAIRLDATWLVIAVLVAAGFWARFAVDGDHGGGWGALMGLAAALLFFGSILAHELAHALVARQRGLEVRSITLFLFGGVTESSFAFRRPADEVAMVAAGPATSVGLAGALGGITWAATAAGLEAVAAVTGVLAWLNLGLGLFNLVPGAPLDGGRLVQAAVWRATGDRHHALVVAGQAGRVVGVGLAAVGLVLFLFVPAGVVDGPWLALIGWFVHRAASAEVARGRLEEILAAMPIGHLLAAAPGPVPASATVHDAELALVGAREEDVLAVVDHGAVVGAVGPADVRAVPLAERMLLPVTWAMAPAAALAHVDAEADAAGLLDLPADEPVVVDVHGRPAGALTPARAVRLATRAPATSGRPSRSALRRWVGPAR